MTRITAIEVPSPYPAQPPGLALPAGPAGASAFEVDVMQGFAGSRDEWLAPLAYRAVVAAGYTGTLELWIATLGAATFLRIPGTPTPAHIADGQTRLIYSTVTGRFRR